MKHKQVIFILLSYFLISCSQTDRKIQAEEINKFESYLGTDKANTLNEIVGLFDKILQENYKSVSKLSDCYILFLEDVKNQNDISFVFKLSESKKGQLKAKIDSCGLRKDIWLYPNEFDYDTLVYEMQSMHNDSIGLLDSLDLDFEIIPINEESIYPADWADSMIIEYESRLDSVLIYNVNGHFINGLQLVQDIVAGILFWRRPVEHPFCWYHHQFE